MFHELYATVLTLVSLLMFCVNRSLSIQYDVERFVKAGGSEVRAHAVVLRFKKFKLKLTTEVLRCHCYAGEDLILKRLH